MITQILDVEITINQKKLQVINTEISIKVDWNILLQENENNANINIVINEIKGYFITHESHTYYKKETTIKFTTDKSWEYEIIGLKNTIEPIYANINFDAKKAKISMV